jgi:hypothetical protein
MGSNKYVGRWITCCREDAKEVTDYVSVCGRALELDNLSM